MPGGHHTFERKKKTAGNKKADSFSHLFSRRKHDAILDENIFSVIPATRKAFFFKKTLDTGVFSSPDDERRFLVGVFDMLCFSAGGQAIKPGPKKRMDAMNEETARAMKTFVACGKEKSSGTVVCWDCFKYRTDIEPLKYFCGTFSEWLNIYKSTVKI